MNDFLYDFSCCTAAADWLLIDRLDRNLSLSEPRNRENHYCKPQLAVKIKILSQLLSFFIFHTFIIKAEVHLTMSN